MKKERFPNIKIEIKAEGLAKKILGKPAASTPSVYGEEQPEGKNLPNVSIKGKNQELQALLETSNKKPVYTGLVKEALLELRKDMHDDEQGGRGGAGYLQRTPKAKYGGLGAGTTPGGLGTPAPERGGSRFDLGGTSAMDEGAPTETGTRAMGTRVEGGEGESQIFTPPPPQFGEAGYKAPDFDMAAGAKASSMRAEVNQAPSPEDMGTSGPGPTKYVGNLQIPSNIASQGQDAIDEFVKRATTPGSAGDGLMQNNMEKAPAPPKETPLQMLGAEAVSSFFGTTASPVQKAITDMTVQELVKDAAFELRKDDERNYGFGSRLADAMRIAGTTELAAAGLSKLKDLGKVFNLIEDKTNPKFQYTGSKPPSGGPLRTITESTMIKDPLLGTTKEGTKQVKVPDYDKRFKMRFNQTGKTMKKFKTLFGNTLNSIINPFAGGRGKGNPFGPKGRRGPSVRNPLILVGTLLGPSVVPAAMKNFSDADQKDIKTINQAVDAVAGYLPFRQGPEFPELKQLDRALSNVFGENVGVPFMGKNIQKAPMVGGAAGQMPQATTMNRPANMGVNVQQPVVTGAGTMKNIEKRVAANKPKAVGAPKKTRATKRKGR